MTTMQHSSGSTHTEAILRPARSTRARTALRRSGAAVGAAALVGLALSGPASARQDPGGATKQQHRTNIEMPYDQEARYGTTSHGSTPASTAQAPGIDDNALEYLQIGLGALGGLAVAGAAAGAVTARQRHQHAM